MLAVVSQEVNIFRPIIKSILKDPLDLDRIKICPQQRSWIKHNKIHYSIYTRYCCKENTANFKKWYLRQQTASQQHHGAQLSLEYKPSKFFTSQLTWTELLLMLKHAQKCYSVPHPSVRKTDSTSLKNSRFITAWFEKQNHIAVLWVGYDFFALRHSFLVYP
jgi:hypothetical protein